VKKRISSFSTFPLCGILMDTTFRKLDVFPFLGEGVEDTYSVGSA
jgi:hypothetical protein